MLISKPLITRSALFCSAVFSLFSVLALSLLLVSHSSFAQDSSAGRYRPEGRQIARAFASANDERLFEVRSYDPDVSFEQFKAATVFYPLTLSFDAPVGSVVFMPGYQAPKDVYDWWGPALASLGYAVAFLDTNTPTDSLAARKAALMAGIELLETENSRSDSPLNGKLDTRKMALMGHSMGGGAALAAAAELGDRIQAVIPLAPYCCEPRESFTADYSQLAVASLIFVSAEDSIAPPEQHARMLFEQIPDSTAKAYIEFASGNHNIPANGGPDLASFGSMSLAWLKIHLDGKEALRSVFSRNDRRFSRLDLKL